MPANARHEHQQRRFRQMEVGEQPVDDAEAIAGRDEEPRFALRRRARVPSVVGGRFERAHGSSCRRRGRGRRARASRRSPRRSPPERDTTRHASVLGEILGVDRLERARADVQRDAGDRDARRFRVPPGAPSSKCRPAVGAATAPGVPRVDRLVARLVVGFGCSRDVRRQRHLAVAVEIVERAARRPRGAARRSDRRRSTTVAARVAGKHELAARSSADGSRAAGRAPRSRPRRRSSSSSTLPPVGLSPRQPRLDHARVVEDEQIAGRDEPRQIGEREIGERRAIDVQQPAARALAAAAPARSARAAARSRSRRAEGGTR